MITKCIIISGLLVAYASMNLLSGARPSHVTGLSVADSRAAVGGQTSCWKAVTKNCQVVVMLCSAQTCDDVGGVAVCNSSSLTTTQPGTYPSANSVADGDTTRTHTGTFNCAQIDACSSACAFDTTSGIWYCVIGSGNPQGAAPQNTYSTSGSGCKSTK